MTFEKDFEAQPEVPWETVIEQQPEPAKAIPFYVDMDEMGLMPLEVSPPKQSLQTMEPVVIENTFGHV